MPESKPARPWIAHAQLNPRARLRLFCFPYAGGNAALYRRWHQELPPDVEVLPVELPGRGSRFRDPPFNHLGPLVEALVPALSSLMDMPCAFFGHSMGALISFELARELRRRGLPQPTQLFVSARRAPHVPDDDPPIHDLPEPEFVEELRTLNGTPEEVLQHPELMNLMIPLLRADFAINETYAFASDMPLDSPIHVFGGLEDEEVNREQLGAWEEHTTAGFKLRMFPGDHFFISGAAHAALLRSLYEDLTRLVWAPESRQPTRP
jgi:surfactin synthase thioesterase subunit